MTQSAAALQNATNEKRHHAARHERFLVGYTTMLQQMVPPSTKEGTASTLFFEAATTAVTQTIPAPPPPPVQDDFTNASTSAVDTMDTSTATTPALSKEHNDAIQCKKKQQQPCHATTIDKVTMETAQKRQHRGHQVG